MIRPMTPFQKEQLACLSMVRRYLGSLSARQKKEIEEKTFNDAGHVSSLMYMHNSPGLLRVKRRTRHE